MVSIKSLFVAAMATAAYAAPTCQTNTPALPKTGGAKELEDPAANLVLKKIALGYGIQNYTCADDQAGTDAKAAGAVAVLYDVTNFYPGTSRTGIPQPIWDKLPETVLRFAPYPLNRQPGSTYGADPVTPFPKAKDVTLPAGGPTLIKFLGHHYFDASGTPMFDLNTIGLKASVVKKEAVDAPKNAYKGTLGTGAVAWLHLIDSGKGLSQGLSTVYRVITAGGVARACSVAGKGVQSVPYTTYYYFY
ncbi:hypothetical protein QBC38DRAFT_288000 [Podospora fimiseda]|uniref:Malate dehydrogenase n=1 Tax=Podospora fimiseda TaxID=252190 RepID=A0AAN7GUM0_9PEZI|nr:hypothetical protein QBC38DRAFT_288000 [Podospora fimiseda]